MLQILYQQNAEIVWGSVLWNTPEGLADYSYTVKISGLDIRQAWVA